MLFKKERVDLVKAKPFVVDLDEEAISADASENSTAESGGAGNDHFIAGGTLHEAEL